MKYISTHICLKHTKLIIFFIQFRQSKVHAKHSAIHPADNSRYSHQPLSWETIIFTTSGELYTEEIRLRVSGGLSLSRRLSSQNTPVHSATLAELHPPKPTTQLQKDTSSNRLKMSPMLQQHWLRKSKLWMLTTVKAIEQLVLLSPSHLLKQ